MARARRRERSLAGLADLDSSGRWRSLRRLAPRARPRSLRRHATALVLTRARRRERSLAGLADLDSSGRWRSLRRLAPRARPRSLRRHATALGLAVALAGCGSSPITVPHPTGADASACALFLAALPQRLADLTLTSKATDGPQASYGDPAIVVSCGVGVPPGFGIGAECQVANGVGWYLPSEQYDDQSLDATVTAAGYQPRVEVDIPARYRPAAVAAVMSELAGPVRKYFTKKTGCV